MKKLTYLLIFCIAPLYAEEIAWTTNQGGGYIILTNETCYMHGKKYLNLYRSYAISSLGQSINACYTLDNSYIRMVYEDNTEYRYHVNAFSFKSKDSI